MLQVNRFVSVKKLVIGLNAIEEIRNEAKELGRSVLIVTDKDLMKVGIVDKISMLLKNSGLNVEIFDECEAEPRLEIYENPGHRATWRMDVKGDLADDQNNKI